MLPPRVAPLQVVIIPIISKKVGMDALMPFVKEIETLLKAADIRVHVRHEHRACSPI